MLIQVALYMSAWIEIDGNEIIDLPTDIVALYMSAWIEMSQILIEGGGKWMSHSI